MARNEPWNACSYLKTFPAVSTSKTALLYRKSIASPTVSQVSAVLVVSTSSGTLLGNEVLGYLGLDGPTTLQIKLPTAGGAYQNVEKSISQRTDTQP
jgi:hypothetical protein